MKSALMAHGSIKVASGADWHGKKNKGAAGVVIFALERAELVKRRLQAHRERLNLGVLPIAVVGSTIDLMSPATVPRIIETIRKIEARLSQGVGLVIFDTFAKLIAAGGGDEDKAKDQGRVFANIQRIKEFADVHIAIVGHTGKDESRGMRGSNAALGDADVMVSISGDVVRTATVTKANDGPDGPLFSFMSQIHEFGRDEDGDPISVNIVSDEAVPLISNSQGKKGGKSLKGAKKVALDLLQKAIDEAGEMRPANNHIPAHTKVVRISTWQRYAEQGSVSESDNPDNRRRTFSRCANGLKSEKLIDIWGDYAWPL